MIFEAQSKLWLEQLAARRNRPVKDSSLDVYKAYLSLIPCEVQGLNLEQIDNATAKKLTDRLVASLAPSTVREVLKIFKRVVASAVDENGNELHSRKWNDEYIDIPRITEQNQPTISTEDLENLLHRADIEADMRLLVALLAGTGLRLGEALALKKRHISDSIEVRATLYRGKEQTPKTKAGVRFVDIPPELSSYMSSFLAEKPDGYLFPYSPATLYRVVDLPGFHSLRRFRATWLRQNNVPSELVSYWLGHASASITEKYVHMEVNAAFRQQEAARVGLGFNLRIQAR